MLSQETHFGEASRLEGALAQQPFPGLSRKYTHMEVHHELSFMPTGCGNDSLQSFHPNTIAGARYAYPLFATRLKPRAQTNKARHGHSHSGVFQNSVFASPAASIATTMTLEHAVGESLVVPGLRLTDHTFQVLLIA